MECNIHLQSWLNRLAGDKSVPAIMLLHDFDLDEVISKTPFNVTFDYPLDRAVTFECPGPVTYGSFIKFVAETYRDKIYPTERVWGHGLGDLYLEGAEFKNGAVHLIMGS